MKKRKFYLELTTGKKFEIHEGDYNIIESRMYKGQTNGWYHQRFDFPEGEVQGWHVAFKDIAMVYADAPPNVDKVIVPEGVRSIEKRKVQPVGKPEEPKGPDCNHNWNEPDDWEYVTCIVNGVQRYHKQCHNCGGRSQLVKKAQVEREMTEAGRSIDDVPLVDVK